MSLAPHPTPSCCINTRTTINYHTLNLKLNKLLPHELASLRECSRASVVVSVNHDIVNLKLSWISRDKVSEHKDLDSVSAGNYAEEQ